MHLAIWLCNIFFLLASDLQKCSVAIIIFFLVIYDLSSTASTKRNNWQSLGTAATKQPKECPGNKPPNFEPRYPNGHSVTRKAVFPSSIIHFTTAVLKLFRNARHTTTELKSFLKYSQRDLRLVNFNLSSTF